MKFLYLVIDAGTIIIPFLFSFHPKLSFFKYWKYAWPAIIISAAIFIIWDIYFTSIGVWGFTAQYLNGLYLYNIPIEEFLFFICIPYACLFTYYCLGILIRKDLFSGISKWISAILIVGLATTAIFNPGRSYTSVTFFLLAIMILVLQYGIKAKWLSRFYFSYLVLLIPFSIVNGILTGATLEKPVVWYNNAQNLGIRLGTIPIEDIFYGMLLFLLNVLLFEHFKSRYHSGKGRIAYSSRP